MAIIKGIPIILYEKTKVGADDFNAPIYEEIPTVVDNVLVGQPTTQEIVDSSNLYGKKAVYILAIPKGDAHIWQDVTVEFFDQKWRTFGLPIKGIDELIPLDWNVKVWVSRYE